MKIRQPFVLLFGGLLSASSLGCSVINAVVSDYRPASRETRGSTERMVAIGRVFESQGKYDQAEAMYRRALKQKPADPSIQEQLQQLADRRSGRRFDSGTTSSAVAAADVRSASGKALLTSKSTERTLTRANRLPSETSSADPSEAFTPPNKGRTQRLELASVSGTEASGTNGVGTNGSVVTAVASSLPTVTVVQSAQRSATVSAESILAAIDLPEEHSALLLNGLVNGDSSETRCLAATLLGDCDPRDDQIRAALKVASETETDPRLLLAVADSRIQRDEADETTADCLIELVQQEVGETRTQALLDLRHFAGTESHEECAAVLQSLLNHDDGSVRAIAAMTLEDFTASNQSSAVNDSEITTEVLPKPSSRPGPAENATEVNPLRMTQPLLPDPK